MRTTQAMMNRYFTSADVNVYDTVEWEKRDSVIQDYKTGTDAFRQEGVEFPASWSMNATNIVSQKYFRGNLGTPEREFSLRQIIDRVANTITKWGNKEGYFTDNVEKNTFKDELKYILLHQYAAFNSPVWFNIGVQGVPQQASACFILDIEDDMNSILNWYKEEGIIFKGGSGSGVNLSPLRSSLEPLKGGGTSSGPVSFMRGADSSAGTIKSGGKTRRAAKMVILNVDHPDIEEFIWCKAIEERKARALRDAGFDMDLDGKDSFSVQYQNANNSVRVTDEFMEAVEKDEPWNLIGISDGKIYKTVSARGLLTEIAEAAWECADPGMQFDTTINSWHTTPKSGRINASNPCSEYMHLDNSSCNLASINLLKFLESDGFNIQAFQHVVQIVFTAQDILVGNADYPTEKIKCNSRSFRQLGLGYANLGALLMAQGLPYDSDAGRDWAAALTSLMTGTAYLTSAHLSERLGPFDGYNKNNVEVYEVLTRHRDEAFKRIDVKEENVPPSLREESIRVWDRALDIAYEYGIRNSQATVLAPTGTIGFMLDCDTTGIEPDLGLVKTKKLVGGGTMQIVNQTVPRSLEHLGYSQTAIEEIVSFIHTNKSIVGCPTFNPEHASVFATSMGDNTIHYMGHVKMMAAVQPFLSGAISKTVNMPEESTVEDIFEILLRGWRSGLKAIAVYRDNCKVGQPISGGKNKDVEVEKVFVQEPIRQRMPKVRSSKTYSFKVGNVHGYATVGEYEDGRPGELFLKIAKQGSSLGGIMDAFAIGVSHGLQYGVPLASYVRAFAGQKFEPAGMTDDPDVRIAQSIVDYLFRRIAIDYLSVGEREALGILTVDERKSEVQDQTRIGSSAKTAAAAVPMSHQGEICVCGELMIRTGSCFACPSCGTTSGCS